MTRRLQTLANKDSLKSAPERLRIVWDRSEEIASSYKRDSSSFTEIQLLRGIRPDLSFTVVLVIVLIFLPNCQRYEYKRLLDVKSRLG